MNLKFWGVRGSLPTPGIEYAKYGGNTSCVELSIGDRMIIFDMGSGLKGLGASVGHYYLFMWRAKGCVFFPAL